MVRGSEGDTTGYVWGNEIPKLKVALREMEKKQSSNYRIN